MFFFIKVMVSAFIIALATELVKYNKVLAAVLVSLPLTSILAFIWIYYESRDVNQIASLSTDVLWLIIPSLVFFITLPLLLKNGLGFATALIISCFVMLSLYGLFVYVILPFALGK